ncbi:hypothetical protein JCM9279_006026 [Rhodotorula babjevae]
MPRATSYFVLFSARKPMRLRAAPYPLLADPRLAIREAHLNHGLDLRDLADLGNLPLHPWLVKGGSLAFQKLAAAAATAATKKSSLVASTIRSNRRAPSPQPVRLNKRKFDDSDEHDVLPEKRIKLDLTRWTYRSASIPIRKPALSGEELDSSTTSTSTTTTSTDSDDDEAKKLEAAMARYRKLCEIDQILKAEKERQAAVTSNLIDHLNGLENVYLNLAFIGGNLDAPPVDPTPTQPKKKTFATTSTRLSYAERFPDADYVPEDLADQFATPAEVRRSHRIASRRERIGFEPLVDLSDSDSEGGDEGELAPLELSSDDEDIKPVLPRPAMTERRNKRKIKAAPIILSDSEDDELAAPVNKRARTASPKLNSVKRELID